MLKLEIANNSDSGRRRKNNEDSTASDHECGIVMVADGMGGYRAGEVASSIAVSSILRSLYEKMDAWETKASQAADNDTPTERDYCHLLRHAVENAHADISTQAQKEKECQGMGTTIVVAIFHGNTLSIAHVGDSRLYRLRGGEFKQITRDHSLYQELIDRGLCSPEEALKYANKSVVTRALGIKRDVEVEVQEEQLQSGDIYLLCSDGLNDMLVDRQIHLTIRKFDDNLETAAMELIRSANARGGRDNISVVLARPVAL